MIPYLIPHPQMRLNIDDYITKFISNISIVDEYLTRKTLTEIFKEMIVNNMDRNTLKSCLLKIINSIELHVIKIGVNKDKVNSITLDTSNKIIDCFYISNMEDIMNDFLTQQSLR